MTDNQSGDKERSCDAVLLSHEKGVDESLRQSVSHQEQKPSNGWCDVPLDRKVELFILAGGFAVALIIMCLTYKQLGILQGQLDSMNSQLGTLNSQSASMQGQLNAMKTQSDIMQGALEVSRQSMEGEQRAWLTPVRAEINRGNVAVGQPLHLIIRFGNAGKEPALNFVGQETVKTFKYPGDNHSWYETFTPQHIEHICSRTHASDGGGAFYPSQASDYGYVIDIGNPPITKEVMSGREVLYIEGCFAYKTFKRERISSYCFMLIPEKGKQPKEWKFSRCMYGNDDIT